KLEICGLSSQRKSTTVEAQDAYVKVDGSRATIVPEKEGNRVDRTIATEMILDAARAVLRGEGTQHVDLRDLCTEPSIKSTDKRLIAEKAMLEKVLERTITINTTSYSSEVLKGAEILGFFDSGEEGLSLNEEGVEEYAQGIAHDYYINRYEYLLYDDLLEKLKSALVSEKPEDKNVTITASWYINYPQPRTNGNGSPSFIEISISQQYLWYYENGTMILSGPVVTGNAKKSPTPTGYFMIRQRDRDAQLIGEDYDLTVSYWMGIDSYGITGIHDASWRWDFGGDIYLENGSHGCINMPTELAAELFSHVKVGVTEVYIY
ncbi:MAG: L,D-transpeptidase family protein, partial [Firmicutes bacterium]|nr:L,D-transpeptidase family protein [Bacillota bacterium]